MILICTSGNASGDETKLQSTNHGICISTGGEYDMKGLLSDNYQLLWVPSHKRSDQTGTLTRLSFCDGEIETDYAGFGLTNYSLS